MSYEEKTITGCKLTLVCTGGGGTRRRKPSEDDGSNHVIRHGSIVNLVEIQSGPHLEDHQRVITVTSGRLPEVRVNYNVSSISSLSAVRSFKVNTKSPTYPSPFIKDTVIGISHSVLRKVKSRCFCD